MIVAGRRQETAIPFVADQGLVALLQLPFERGQDGGPGGGVLLHLVAIATDDVAPPGQSDGLGLVFDVLLPLCQNERDEGSGIVEHEFAHELVGALANAENVQEPARLQFGLATAFNDLEIGATAGGLLAEVHGAEPWERLMRGPHIISKKHRASQTKSKTTWHYIFAKSTPRSNNINDLPPVSGSQVLKISLNGVIHDRVAGNERLDIVLGIMHYERGGSPA